MKWYVPTSEQLMGMYLGAKSLPSPLVDSENINFIYSERGNYHYSTSDKKRIWGEEGASVGDLYADGGNAWGAGSAQNFRCVRNLGIDITQANDIKKETYPKQAFEYKEKATVKVYNKILDTDETVDKERIFVMSKLTDQNIRSRLQQGELAIHNNFEDVISLLMHSKWQKTRQKAVKETKAIPSLLRHGKESYVLIGMTGVIGKAIIELTMATAVGAKIIPRKKTKETKVFGEHLIKGK